jgi:hypothetical protein
LSAAGIDADKKRLYELVNEICRQRRIKCRIPEDSKLIQPDNYDLGMCKEYLGEFHVPSLKTMEVWQAKTMERQENWKSFVNNPDDWDHKIKIFRELDVTDFTGLRKQIADLTGGDTGSSTSSEKTIERQDVVSVEMCQQFLDECGEPVTAEKMEVWRPKNEHPGEPGNYPTDAWVAFIKDVPWHQKVRYLRLAGAKDWSAIGIKVHKEGNLIIVDNYDSCAVTFSPRSKRSTQEDIIEAICLREPRFIEKGNEEELIKLEIEIDKQLTEIYSQYEKDKKLDQLLKGEDISKALTALDIADANSQEVFLDEFGEAFAAMNVEDHIEIHPMEEDRFKNWISGLFYKEENDLLNEQDLTKIIRILKAKAEFDPSIPRRRLDVRVRGFDSNTYNNYNDQGDKADDDEDDIENFTEIYYDLTNRHWQAVRLTPQGWTIENNPPILFRRYGAEKPQCYPADPNTAPPDILEKFVALLNLKKEKEDEQKMLLKVDVVSQYWPNVIPKPILMMLQVQGSAKTTMAELVKDAVDPSAAKTASLPKEAINLKQFLAHNYCAFFDNVSSINDEQADILCRAVTGAGDMKRKLYENNEDVIYRYRRIISLNGITNPTTRGDVLQRGLIIDPAKIEKKDRKLLRAIRRQYRKLKPQLLSFCFDVIVEVMKERQKWRGIDEDLFGLGQLIAEKVGGPPRMADYAVLGEQIAAKIAEKEGKPYEPGSFLKAFEENVESLNTEALKESLVAEALIAFMTDLEVTKKKIGIDGRAFWDGSPTQLLAELEEFIAIHEDVKINTTKKPWPQNPSQLGTAIQEISENLARIDIVIDRHRTKDNVQYNISKMAVPPTPPTPPTPGQKSSSNDGQNGVGTDVGAPTPPPTPENPENRAQNGDGCKGVGGVGYVPKSSTMGTYYACPKPGCQLYFDEPVKLLKHLHEDCPELEDSTRAWMQLRGLLPQEGNENARE